MTLTDEQKRKYLNGGYGKCPFCGSDAIEGGFIEVDGDSCWQPVTCTDCGKRWNDIYRLADVEEKA